MKPQCTVAYWHYHLVHSDTGSDNKDSWINEKHDNGFMEQIFEGIDKFFKTIMDVRRNSSRVYEVGLHSFSNKKGIVI